MFQHQRFWPLHRREIQERRSTEGGRNGQAGERLDLRQTRWKLRGIERKMGKTRTVLQKPGAPDGSAGAWVEPSCVVVMCLAPVFSERRSLGPRVVIWRSERVTRTCWGRYYVTINCVRAAESSRSTNVATEIYDGRICRISRKPTQTSSRAVGYATDGAQWLETRWDRRRE